MRHVVKEFVPGLFAGALQRHHEQIRLDVAHHHLNGAVIHHGEVLEGEHVVLNLEREVLVQLSQRLHHRRFKVDFDEVHDLGGRLHATKAGRLRGGVTGELLGHDALQLLHRGWLNRLKAGDTLHDLTTILGR